MPTAVLAFDFDPLLHVGDGAVRWETIAVAVAIFAAITLGGVSVRSLGLGGDDLLFVILGVVPGAVLGGRLGYVLLHLAFFSAAPERILDPGIGSLELSLAVVGGTITGCMVAILLDDRPGPWLRAATFPVLLLLAAGKLAAVLGGSGQGAPTAGEPATAYLGGGPWATLGPAIPSVPSQALEGIAALVVTLIVVLVSLAPRMRRPDGRLFLFALALWAISRAVVASTWRDPLVLGPFRMGQILAVVVALVAMVSLTVLLATRHDNPRTDPVLWDGTSIG